MEYTSWLLGIGCCIEKLIIRMKCQNFACKVDKFRVAA